MIWSRYKWIRSSPSARHWLQESRLRLDSLSCSIPSHCGAPQNDSPFTPISCRPRATIWLPSQPRKLQCVSHLPSFYLTHPTTLLSRLSSSHFTTTEANIFSSEQVADPLARLFSAKVVPSASWSTAFEQLLPFDLVTATHKLHPPNLHPRFPVEPDSHYSASPVLSARF